MLKGKLVIFSILVLILTVLTGGQPPAEAADNKSDHQVIIVLLDKVTWEEIAKAKAPFLKRLIDEGAAGLLSNHTAVSFTNTPRSYATIGAGNRSQAFFKSGLALNASERFEDDNGDSLYQRQTGLDPGRSQVFFLDLAGLQKANLSVGYTVIPGTLGQVFHEKGLKTAVLGNADIDHRESYQREAAIIAMDKDGKVDYGDISRKLLVKDNLSPYGLRTDYDLLLNKFKQIKNKAGLIVIETGDSRRADSFQNHATVSVSHKYKRDAIERADAFLKRVYGQVDHKKVTLMVVSPSPPIGDNGLIVQQLTPIIVVGPNFKSGLLTSGFTRRPALVASTDIAPTAMKVSSLPAPFYLTGQAMTSEPAAKDKISYLVNSNLKYQLADRVSFPIIITYVVFQIIALLAAVLLLWAQIKITRPIFVILTYLLLIILALPMGFFVAALFGASFISAATYIIAIALIVIAAVVISKLSGDKKIWPPLFISAATVLFMMGDLLFFGAESNLRSVFGYSPVVAGRFYGIGNQAMSVLVAASIVAASLFLERINYDENNPKSQLIKLGTLFFFLISLFFIGFPGLGANTGGTITAVVGFTVAYIQFFQRGIKARQIALILAGVIVILSLFILADLYLLPVKTHMARSFIQVADGGFDQFWQIANRKLQANIRIYKYTSWSYLFLTIVVTLLFLRFFRPLNTKQHLLTKYRYLYGGLTAGLIGGIVGALANDSGISIPAIILAYFLSVIFYLAIYDRYEQGERDEDSVN